MTNLGTATGSISINASGAQQGANQAANALERLTVVVRDNWWGLRNLGLAFSGFSLAVVGAMAKATQAAIEWEAAMAGVERTTYDNTKSAEENAAALAVIDDQLRDLASIKPVDSLNLASIAEDLGALGIAAKDIPAATSVIADLIATTDLSQDAATTGLARIAGLLGVTSDEYDNLGSAVLEAGRTTAATESDIVNLATRLAPAGAAVGATADQLIGLSAAVLSAGIKSEAGGTAISKTFTDIQGAVSEGGQSLEIFAAITGQTSDEFAASFGADAVGTLEQVIVGLGRMQNAGVDLNGVLRDLGITEARQVRTILGLVAAQNQSVNENFQLSTILDTTNAAFEEGNALQEISGKRYETTAAQIQLLKNQLDEAGRVFGEVFLPFIKFAVGALTDFLKGLSALPQPVRVVIIIIGLVTAGIAALAAGLLLLGPRILLVRESLQQLALAAGQSGVAITGAAASTAAASASMARSATLLNAASGSVAVKNSAASIANVGAAAAGSTPLLAKLASGTSKFGKTLGWVGLALTAVTVGLTLFGGSMDDAVDPAEELVTTNQALVDSIRQQADGIDNSVDKWVAETLAMSGAVDMAKELGISVDTLKDIITGTDPEAAAEFVNKYKDATEDTAPAAKGLYDIVRALTEEYRDSFEVYRQSVAAKQALGIADEDAATAELELARSLEETARAIEKQNRAISSYVDALQGQRSAYLDLQKASAAYAKTLQDSERYSRELEQATYDLEQSQFSYSQSLRNLEDAEKGLANARKDQLDELADAELDYEDSKDRQQDSLKKVLDLEEELDKLRGGPTIRELVKATNNLKKAQDKLGDSEQDLADAEWYLQYLREEGASDRDIKDAEEAVADARDATSYASEDLADAESDLNDLRIDSPAYQEEILAAEQDLEEARRDVERGSRELERAEEELRQLREDVANDTAYKDAEIARTQALNDVAAALYAIRDAELALEEARSGRSVADEQAQAQEDIEAAIYRTAQANVEARKQAALARGETVDAGTEAIWLAEELEKLEGWAPNADALGRMRTYIRLLRRATPAAEEVGGGDGGGSASPVAPIIPPLTPDSLFPDPAEVATEAKSWFERVKEALGGGGGIGSLVGGGIGSVIGTALGGPVGTVIGGILGSIVGYIVGWLVEKFWPQISNFFTNTIPEWAGKIGGFFKAIPEKIGEALSGIGGILSGIWETVTDLLPEDVGKYVEGVVGFFTGLPGKILGVLGEVAGAAASVGRSIGNGLSTGFTTVANFAADVAAIPGKVIGWIGNTASTLVGKGKDLIIGLWNGAVGWINEAGGLISRVAELPGKIFGWLGDTGKSLLGAGRNLIIGLWNGLIGWVNEAGGFAQRIADLPGNIVGWLGDTGSALLQSGKNIIIGLWNGISEKFTEFFSGAGSAWNGLIDLIPGGFADFLKIGSPSKVFEDLGGDVIDGLVIGLVGSQRAIAKSMETVASAMQLPATQLDTSWLETISDLQNDRAFMTAAQNVLLETQSQVDISRAAPPEPPSLNIPPTTQNNGDTFQISNVEKANPEEIAAEVMFKKLVRLRS